MHKRYVARYFVVLSRGIACSMADSHFVVVFVATVDAFPAFDGDAMHPRPFSGAAVAQSQHDEFAAEDFVVDVDT